MIQTPSPTQIATVIARVLADHREAPCPNCDDVWGDWHNAMSPLAIKLDSAVRDRDEWLFTVVLSDGQDCQTCGERMPQGRTHYRLTDGGEVFRAWR